MSITRARNGNSTDKPEVDGALILNPALYQCSVSRVLNMYLLTEWEGRTGKYLARGHFFSGNKIWNVAHFDRKVGIYTATKLL